MGGKAWLLASNSLSRRRTTGLLTYSPRGASHPSLASLLFSTTRAFSAIGIIARDRTDEPNARSDASTLERLGKSFGWRRTWVLTAAHRNAMPA